MLPRRRDSAWPRGAPHAPLREHAAGRPDVPTRASRSVHKRTRAAGPVCGRRAAACRMAALRMPRRGAHTLPATRPASVLFHRSWPCRRRCLRLPLLRRDTGQVAVARTLRTSRSGARSGPAPPACVRRAWVAPTPGGYSTAPGAVLVAVGPAILTRCAPPRVLRTGSDALPTAAASARAAPSGALGQIAPRPARDPRADSCPSTARAAAIT